MNPFLQAKLIRMWLGLDALGPTKKERRLAGAGRARAASKRNKPTRAMQRAVAEASANAAPRP